MPNFEDVYTNKSKTKDKTCNNCKHGQEDTPSKFVNIDGTITQIFSKRTLLRCNNNRLIGKNQNILEHLFSGFYRRVSKFGYCELWEEEIK